MPEPRKPALVRVLAGFSQTGGWAAARQCPINQGLAADRRDFDGERRPVLSRGFAAYIKLGITMLAVLDLVLFFGFGVMSYRITTAVARESAVLREFKQRTTLALLVLLFPFGPLLLLLGPVLMSAAISFPAAIGCYVPALVIARQQSRALGKAGTDRVRGAQSAIDAAFGTALVGLIYVAVVSLFVFGSVVVGRHA